MRSDDLCMALIQFQRAHLPEHPVEARWLEAWQCDYAGSPTKTIGNLVLTCGDQMIRIYDRPTDHMMNSLGLVGECVIDFDGKLVGCGGEEIPDELVLRITRHLLGAPLALGDRSVPGVDELDRYAEFFYRPDLDDWTAYLHARAAVHRADKAMADARDACRERDRILDQAGLTLSKVVASIERRALLDRGRGLTQDYGDKKEV